MLLAVFVILLALKIGNALPINWLGVFIPLAMDAAISVFNLVAAHRRAKADAAKKEAVMADLREQVLKAVERYRPASSAELARAYGGGIGTSPSYTPPVEANDADTSPGGYTRPRPASEV